MAEHDDVIEGWRKSSRSGDGGCVEVRIGADQVRVRDTKNRPGAFLTFTHGEWRAFLAGVRLGEFDVPEVESA
jgi:Domain of unknown function (DUF397)